MNSIAARADCVSCGPAGAAAQRHARGQTRLLESTNDRVEQQFWMRQVRPSMVLLQLPTDGMGGAAAQLATAPAAACLCGLHVVCSNLK